MADMDMDDNDHDDHDLFFRVSVKQAAKEVSNCLLQCKTWEKVCDIIAPLDGIGDSPVVRVEMSESERGTATDVELTTPLAVGLHLYLEVNFIVVKINRFYTDFFLSSLDLCTCFVILKLNSSHEVRNVFFLKIFLPTAHTFEVKNP
jgi:hypothetical protein